MDKLQNSPIFDALDDMGHEQLVVCHDQATGLRAIIGVHNTVLGPALGGTRMWTYANEADAFNDVMRLSRGMTFKNALAGLNLGGGKAVIIGDSRKDKNEALLRRFGKFVDSLNGKYITAEDVGMTTADMEFIRMETTSVCGTADKSGDPSPFTAYGTYMGVKAAAKQAFGSDSLDGKRIVVQGAGNVGRYLINHLVKEGAKVAVADIFEEQIKLVTDAHSGVEVIDPNTVYDQEMDIYAPCALGATVNDDTLSRLKTNVIAGAANNQLQDEFKHGDFLAQNGYVYVPDFLINAGGVISVYSEFSGAGDAWVNAQVERLYDVALDVLKRSADQKKNAQVVATEMAKERIEAIAKIRQVR